MSTDKGKTWTEAEIHKQDITMEPRHYAWTLWKAYVEVPWNAKEVEVNNFWP